MVAVAVVALSLGGSLYAARLKRQRDRYLAMAALHSSIESQARGSLARVGDRYSYLKRMDQERVPQSVTSDLTMAIDLVSGLPAPGFGQREEVERFREAQAVRERAIATSRWRIEAENQRRNRESLLTRIDYHTALARKYRDGISA
jgi:hypothetical protein